MPGSGEKKKSKTAKAKSVAVKKKRGRATFRANTHSKRSLTQFMSNHRPKSMYLAKFLKLQGSHAVVQKSDKTEETVRIPGKMSLPAGLRHNFAVTALRSETFVLVDGGDIVAMLDADEAENAKESAGWENSANSLFNRGKGSRSRSGSR
jgi:hypothetical protein